GPVHSDEPAVLLVGEGHGPEPGDAVEEVPGVALVGAPGGAPRHIAEPRRSRHHRDLRMVVVMTAVRLSLVLALVVVVLVVALPVFPVDGIGRSEERPADGSRGDLGPGLSTVAGAGEVVADASRRQVAAGCKAVAAIAEPDADDASRELISHGERHL